MERAQAGGVHIGGRQPDQVLKPPASCIDAFRAPKYDQITEVRRPGAGSVGLGGTRKSRGRTKTHTHQNGGGCTDVSATCISCQKFMGSRKKLETAER